MAVSVSYDSVLSRVRLTAGALAGADRVTVERSTDLVRWTTVRGGAAAQPAMTIILTDAFGRTSVNTWGNADTGQAYVTTEGSAAGMAVNGGTGKHIHSALATNRRISVDLGSPNQDVIALVKMPLITGASGAALVDVRVRQYDTLNHIRLRVTFPTGGPITTALTRSVTAGTAGLGAGPSLAHDATHWYGFRLAAEGDAIAIYVWDHTLSGGVVPTVPNLTAVDPSPTVIGNEASFFSFLNAQVTNALPFTVEWDGFEDRAPAVLLDDYEFAPGVSNTYRVRGIETAPIIYLGEGGSAAGNNASVVPALPTAIPLVAGDAMILSASIRNSGAGTVDTPAGWSAIRSYGNAALFGRKYVAGDAAPTVTFTGGVANATTLADIAAFRRADIAPATATDQLNGSAQNVAYPGLTVPVDGCVALAAGWKQDDWTSADPIPGMAEINEATSLLGDDASQVWDYVIQTTKAPIVAGSIVVTGGAAAISRGAAVALPHAAYLNQQTAAITPTLTAVWLKSVNRPFLNRVVKPGGPPLTPTRNARGGVNEVVGRSLPIAVTDVRGSRNYQLRLRTTTPSDAQTMDYVLASGDVLYLHAPAGKGVPAGGVYIRVGDTREVHTHVTGDVIHWTIPVQEAAAPGPDVVAATATWNTVLALYATWDDLLAANPSWESLLQLIADPSEVIVP